MAPSPLQQRRTHNTLLFQKLLNLRDGASPFTLILDTLEQSGATLVREFVRRAKIGKSKIIFISFSTLSKKLSFKPDVFISATGKPLSALRAEILSHIPPPSAPSTSGQLQKCLLIIDTLHPLSTSHPTHLPPFLTSLLHNPTTSLLATYHTDIPLPSSSSNPGNPYNPHPLTTLTHLATALLTPLSLPHLLTQKRARDKSLQPPSFAVAEYAEGVLISLGRKGGEGEIVVEMEIRRRSGRGVVETFVLSPPSSSSSSSTQSLSSSPTNSKLSTITLLTDHPLYTTIPPTPQNQNQNPTENEEEDPESTFSMSLTDKQRKDREGVVLPYFDAQKGGGPGEGGRILYEMGEEDREDFDDEEDEV